MASNGAFDLAVIGSGPGGYVAAIRAAQLGLKTAVVERDPAGCGGTCLQRGCVPTKALLHTADLYQDLRRAKDFGIAAESVRLDLPAVMSRKARIVKRLSKGIESHLFRKHGITFFRGHGRLDGRGTIVVANDQGETRLSTQAILLATGSRPKALPNLPADGRHILTSDELLEIKEVPRRLAVIGAGAVGVEFASMFSRFGSVVTLVEMLPRILPYEDEEISAEAAKLLGKQMTIHTGARVDGARLGDGEVELTYTTSAGERQVQAVDVLLVAVGRGPVTDGLNLESTGVETERGYVRVNPRMETAQPGIYAIGDVVTVEGRPHPQLAHVASHEGIGVAERLAGQPTDPLNYDRIPSATYCRPEVAAVGLSEAEARKRGFEVRVGRFAFGNLAKPRILGHEEGLVKVVSDARYDEVLGVHMLGPHATDLIAAACVGLQLEATTADLFRTVHPHPTLSEALMQAAEAVYGHAIDG